MGKHIEYDNAYTHKVTEDAINGVIQCDGAGNYSAAGSLYTLPSLLSVASIQVTNINGSPYSTGKSLGAWSLATLATTYLASTDGIVSAYIKLTSGSDAYKALIGYDGLSGASIARISTTCGKCHPGTAQVDMDYGGFSMPVSQNSYWMVNQDELNAGGTYTIGVYWKPLS